MSVSYRDLKVWQCSMKVVLTIYRLTGRFPKEELYGLVSQMRRAAVSVPSNIAEGKGRLTDRDRAHFYIQARGSLLELETQILIARELKSTGDRVGVITRISSGNRKDAKRSRRSDICSYNEQPKSCIARLTPDA